MNIDAIAQDDKTSEDGADDFGPERYGVLPTDAFNSLTEHFLALMGSEPLQPHERYAA